jgi:DNA-binding MarR family transcriptional regulator
MYHMWMADTTPDQVAVAILETIPTSMHAIREQMRSGRVAGLPVAQFRLLVYVRRNPGTSLTAVADHLGTTLPAASQLVERLVQDDLVTRVKNPQERRRLQLRVTDAGTAALAETDEHTRAWLCRALSGLDSEELERIQVSLRQVRAALLAPGPREAPPVEAAEAAGG